ncbi:MAG: hypothetical protein EXR88_04925 [Gammaproteobacteria bacterium]|nr:hypothetical protein [Gammaproteobacteria bacterium]
MNKKYLSLALLPNNWLVVVVFFILIFSLLGGCAERDDWRSAKIADTSESYEAFLLKHPVGRNTTTAKRRIEVILEEKDWQKVVKLNMAEEYRNFIDAHPKGVFTAQARAHIATLLVDIAPPSYDTLASTPNAEPILRSDAMIDSPIIKPLVSAVTISYRIQLGVFSTRQKAAASWQEAHLRHSELQGLVPQFIEGETLVSRLGSVGVYRVQASIASELRAREICQALNALSQACIYIPPVK